jgi:NACalpha-BTF3-like transcription factor
MSKVHAEPTQELTARCFGFLMQLAEEAVKKETDMTNALGLDQINDVLRLQAIKHDLNIAINEATILLMNLKARAEAVSQMAKDLM